MRDIERRIQRYRLSRYGSTGRRWPIRWVWAALGAWLLWAGVASDHSFYQLWKLQRENARQRATLASVREQLRTLERETSDPALRREQAERVLREQNGMARPGEIIYRIESDSAHTRGD